MREQQETRCAASLGSDVRQGGENGGELSVERWSVLAFLDCTMNILGHCTGVSDQPHDVDDKDHSVGTLDVLLELVLQSGMSR